MGRYKDQRSALERRVTKATPSRKAPAALTTRARAIDISAVVDCLDQIETWLAGGLSPRQAEVKARNTWNMRRVKSAQLVGAALRRMHKDTTGEPVESKRARSIAFWQAQQQRALDRKKYTILNDGEQVSTPDPDLKAANQARAALDAIEGVTSGAHALATPRRDGE